MMSFELPANVERELERYAQSEHISKAEAAVKLIQSGLRVTRHESSADSITDTEVAAFEKAFPGLKQLDDVTDEQWDKVLKSTRRMSREGLSTRG